MDILTTLRETFFDLDAMRAALPELLRVGLPNTLILALTSAVIGTVLGMVLAVCGLSHRRWLRWPARVFTDIFRGLPAAVTILLIGVGLSPVGLHVWGPNPYPLGILALSLIASAYIGEIFRSGIQSVDTGQLEAARALGFSRPSGMRLVVIPQGVRRVLPGPGEPVHRAHQGVVAGLLPRAARQPARPLPDRSGRRRQHREPSRAGPRGRCSTCSSPCR